MAVCETKPIYRIGRLSPASSIPARLVLEGDVDLATAVDAREAALQVDAEVPDDERLPGGVERRRRAVQRRLEGLAAAELSANRRSGTMEVGVSRPFGTRGPRRER